MQVALKCFHRSNSKEANLTQSGFLFQVDQAFAAKEPIQKDPMRG